MNKLRSKKYIHWQIPSPEFTPGERNRILKLLFEAEQSGEWDGINDLIDEGIFTLACMHFKKRPNGKYFHRSIRSFAKSLNYYPLFKYFYTKKQAKDLDRNMRNLQIKIDKIKTLDDDTTTFREAIRKTVGLD